MFLVVISTFKMTKANKEGSPKQWKLDDYFFRFFYLLHLCNTSVSFHPVSNAISCSSIGVLHPAAAIDAQLPFEPLIC